MRQHRRQRTRATAPPVVRCLHLYMAMAATMTQQPRMAARATMTRPPGAAAKVGGKQEGAGEASTTRDGPRMVQCLPVLAMVVMTTRNLRRRRRRRRRQARATTRALTLMCMKMISNEALLQVPQVGARSLFDASLECEHLSSALIKPALCVMIVSA